MDSNGIYDSEFLFCFLYDAISFACSELAIGLVLEANDTSSEIMVADAPLECDGSAG
jgi:hypothetical protein